MRGWSRLLLEALVCWLLAASGAQAVESIARAQELLDSGDAAAAVSLLDRLLAARSDDAQALLLRSTGHFLLGDRKSGEKDLERALKLDPGMRQGWLNLAGVRIAEERYDEAERALREAQRLDPQAADNELNLGVVALLQGRLEEASASFDAYLRRSAGAAEAYYQVASNYAVAGYAGLAIEHLETGIARDERVRLRARTDPHFAPLEDDPRLVRLLEHDGYAPPPGSYGETRVFSVAYDGQRGTLLGAVIDALGIEGFAFDARVEVSSAWALIWGEMRIKVYNDEKGRINSRVAPER
jgi:tetratricopeptide (TPR) repeat protein